jgi:hypothetical protein
MGFQLPGFEQGRTYQPREIFFSTQNQEFHPGGIILDNVKCSDGSNAPYQYEIRAGWWVGRYTAVPTLFRLCTRTTAAAAGTTSTALTVVNAAAFVVGDSIKVGANTAQAVVAINYTTNVITLTTAITWNLGDAVIGQDGSQVAVGVLPEFSKLKNVDNTVAMNKSAKLAVGGELIYEMLLGDTAAILADPAALLSNFRFFQGGLRIR